MVEVLAEVVRCRRQVDRCLASCWRQVEVEVDLVVVLVQVKALWPSVDASVVVHVVQCVAAVLVDAVGAVDVAVVVACQCRRAGHEVAVAAMSMSKAPVVSVVHTERQ